MKPGLPSSRDRFLPPECRLENQLQLHITSIYTKDLSRVVLKLRLRHIRPPNDYDVENVEKQMWKVKYRFLQKYGGAGDNLECSARLDLATILTDENTSLVE